MDALGTRGTKNSARIVVTVVLKHGDSTSQKQLVSTRGRFRVSLYIASIAFLSTLHQGTNAHARRLDLIGFHLYCGYDGCWTCSLMNVRQIS